MKGDQTKIVKKLSILYVRVSTLDQTTDRQKVEESKYDLVIEDKCSGTIPFFERPGGKQIFDYMQKEVIESLAVWQIDRLGRNLRDVINTIHYFSERKVCIQFVSQGLRTLEADRKENPISKLIISVLGVVGEMEKNLIRERQLDGIKLAKARGVYQGRKSDTKEDTLKFLSKIKNRKALDYLRKGYKGYEAAKLAGVHINTITKIKRLAAL